MANSEVVLSLKNATLSIQEKELFSNLSFQVCAGEIVLICGRSGVGKSSLMNIINGVYPNEEVSHFVIQVTLLCNVPGGEIDE